MANDRRTRTRHIRNVSFYRHYHQLFNTCAWISLCTVSMLILSRFIDGPRDAETQHNEQRNGLNAVDMTADVPSGELEASAQDHHDSSASCSGHDNVFRGRRLTNGCVGARGTIWEERGYNYYPFEDMFYPYEPGSSAFRSLVLFTTGRSGMDNVNSLISSWGLEHFDYVLMHFDNSSSEWSRFPWYGRVVSITAQRQAKLWFYKRFASPWLVKGYRYVHFVDSDAGSPPNHSFDLLAYENILYQHGVLIAQPATSHGGRSSDHPISRVHSGNLLRWTSFVENGPIFSVAQRAYECCWETINADLVSGWGADFGWCQYAVQACGFPDRRTCAVVDSQYIVHLDLRTASAQRYRNLTYEDYGRHETDIYRKRFTEIGVKGFKSFDNYETIPEI